MRKFLAQLFVSQATTSCKARKAQLNLDAMEDRFAPALLANPYAIRGFDPQPEPPSSAVAIPGVYATIPGVHSTIPGVRV